MATLITTLLATTTIFFASTHALNTRVVHQFSNPTWLENISAMHNGSLLVSMVGRPEVHIINPLVTPSTASLVARIPNVNAIFGISELSDAVFAVAAGNSTPENAPIPGSFSVWSIDLSHKHHDAKVNKIADVPAVGMINGLATLNEHTLLMADSWKGNIAALDSRTGETDVWLEDASTAANFSAPGLPLGVNGIKVHKEWVYYTNTVHNSLSRVRVHVSTAKLAGEIATLAQGEKTAIPDDFEVLGDRSVILGRPLSDELVQVSTTGTVDVLVKGESVEGVTAVTLSRSKKDKSVAYLSSMGGFNVDGSVKAGGRVIAVELR